MSSDCSICILKCPALDGSGDEWRVQHINSAHWEYSDHQQQHGNVDELLNYIRADFRDAPVFKTEAECDSYVDELDNKLQEVGLPEYGETYLSLTFPLLASQKDRGLE